MKDLLIRKIISEYETCNHNSSDLIIELDDAKIILNLIEKQQKEISLLKDQLEYVKSEKVKQEEK